MGAPGARVEFEDAGVIAIDAEFGAAGQHAVAFDAVDHLLAEGHVGGDHARPAVGRAADHGLAAVAAGIDDGLHVVAAGDRLDRFHARGAGALASSSPAGSMPSHSAVFMVMSRSSGPGAQSRPSTNSRIQL